MIGPDKDARNKLQLRHPATAESFVEIDYGRQSCALELYLLQLGAKKTSLGVEDFQKTRIAILIAQVRKPQGSLQCLHLPVLRRLLFADLSRCNQRIFHFSETCLYVPASEFTFWPSRSRPLTAKKVSEMRIAKVNRSSRGDELGRRSRSWPAYPGSPRRTPIVVCSAQHRSSRRIA
jgi:hypothetical protein